MVIILLLIAIRAGSASPSTGCLPGGNKHPATAFAARTLSFDWIRHSLRGIGRYYGGGSDKFAFLNERRVRGALRCAW